MTVYVRLVNGAEDSFSPYKGCRKCAYDVTNTHPKLCPNCGADNIDEDGRFAPLLIAWGWWNVAVETPSDGTLIVNQYKTRVAFYPAGSWTSWRSD